MRLIHADATSRGLTLLRRYVYGLWFLIILADPLPVIADLPLSAFKPVGPLLRMLPDSMEPWLLTPGFLYGLKFTAAAALLLAILNYRWKMTSLVSCFLLTIYQGIVRGFGYVDHTELALLFAAYFLSLFSIADALAQDGPEKGSRASPASINLNSVPFVASLAFLLFSYSLTGVNRLTYAGFEVFAPGTLRGWIVMDQHMLHQLFFSWNLADWVMQRPTVLRVLEIGFPLLVVVEVLAPFCLVSRRFRYFFILVMVPFHVLSWVLLKIFFWENLLLYPLFLEMNLWKSR